MQDKNIHTFLVIFILSIIKLYDTIIRNITTILHKKKKVFFIPSNFSYIYFTSFNSLLKYIFLLLY